MHNTELRKRNKAWISVAVAPLVLGLALATPAVQAQEPRPEPGVTAEPEPQVQPPVRVQHPTPAPRGIVQEGAWTISPLIGAGIGNDVDRGLALGLGAGYNWSPRVSFEGELGYSRTSFGTLQPLDTNVVTFNVNGLYHFSTGNVAPYATVGVGLGHANRGADPIDVNLANRDRTSAMFNWGGGVKAPIGDRTNLRVGIRHFSGHDLVPNYWRPYVGVTFNMGPTVW